jgi:hypothetical protein
MTRARTEYEAMVGGLLSNVWKREGEFLTVDPVELNTPLTAVLEAEDAGSTRVDPDWLPEDLNELQYLARPKLHAIILQLIEQLREVRKDTKRVILDYLFAKGPDPLPALERLWMLARTDKGGHVWNMLQSEAAALFGHSKQNWQTLEEKVIEDLITRWSRSEFVNSGGKSVAARLAYAELRKGNSNRKHGRRTGDEMPPLPAKEYHDQPLCDQAKRRAKAMRDQAERKRMAVLCGCRPDELDLNRINPTDD